MDAQWVISVIAIVIVAVISSVGALAERSGAKSR